MRKMKKNLLPLHVDSSIILNHLFAHALAFKFNEFKRSR